MFNQIQITMKKFTAIMAAALVLAGTATAQEKDSRPQRPAGGMTRSEMIQKRTDDVVKKYDLNDKQAKKLLKLNKKYADDLIPERRMGGPGMGPRLGGPSPQGNREADGQVSGDRFNGGNPPQDGQRPQFGNGRGERPELTDEQKAEMKERMQARMEERQKVVNEYNKKLKSIMGEEKYEAYQADREAMMKNMRNRRPGGRPEAGKPSDQNQ